MRRLGIVAFGLAGFLLCGALLLAVYAPGQVKRTPLGVDSTTRLTGMADVLPRGGSAPVKAISRNKSVDKKSDGDVVVFNTFTCLITDPDGTAPDCVDDMDPDERLVSASTDNFATDRRTALAVNKNQYTGPEAVAHEGVVNKLPFGAEKKTYPYWDGLLARAVDLKFEGVEDISGLETYKYRAVSEDEPAEIASGVTGTYSSDKTIWADPVTGAFIKQQEKQVRKTSNGQPVLDLDFGFTDDTIAKNVADAKDNGSRLALLGRLPWVLGAIGLVLLICGAILARSSSSRPRAEGSGARGRPDQDVSPGGRNDRTDNLDVFGDANEDTTVRRSDIHRG